MWFNFLLFFFILIIIRRFYSVTFFKAVANDFNFFYSSKFLNFFLILFFSFFILLFSFFPHYWEKKVSSVSINLPHGITEEGYPWIGAENPELTIFEHTDYLCFQCKKMHYFLRELVSKYSDKLRVVHINFPIDERYNPIVKGNFHEGAGKMALLAIYASKEGKFWEMNDFLYKTGGKDFNLKMVEKATGLKKVDLYKALYYDNSVVKQLKKEIYSGLKLGIKATPS